MYSPKLPEGSIPPRNYPPDQMKLWVGLCLLLPIVGAHVGASRAVFAVLSDGPAALCSHVCMMASGYLFVSYVTLGRERPFLSRYGTLNQFGNVLLFALLSFFLIHSNLWRAVGRDEDGDVHFRPLTFSRLVCFYTGLHFTWLDCSPTLQQIGCKLPVPQHWKELSVSELKVVGLMLLLLGGSLAGVVYELVVLLDSLCGVLTLCLFTKVRRKRGRRGRGACSWGCLLKESLCGVLTLCLFTKVRRKRGRRSRKHAQSMFLGLFVEGVAVWGLDPLLVHKSEMETGKEG
uniref:Uncharacterized protein n=1 Tax=Chromera velia CCMP2878 TaxID=1169474 RepID=A0A0G4EZI9_9ALVE|eukprot:Cvel_14424.t1-p1 / transcript=Cvel_14424.t1 / gene=Cvel_14424 / organism=Chromera_velia_CCMP2878 / gene_product=hypothetical protein / transcript_product=hypothetical protein / location=Cvel_scaffold1025:57323-58494(+) / protein_length=288 / sequence_SO=supercontig / SO=protein_coding / is_pseudo=false